MPTPDAEFISLQEMLGDQSAVNRQMLAQWMKIIDDEVWGHARAVADLVKPIATFLTTHVRLRKALIDAAWFHDIGKLSIATPILYKPGPLDENEWAIIRRHPVEGADYLAKCPALRDAAHYVRHHHERFDGAGYPDGLQAATIPLGAQIVGVADAYNAMVSVRPYRFAMAPTEAFDELRRCAGTQFDPLIVKLFAQIHEVQETGSNK